jgi:hypothetical protein
VSQLRVLVLAQDLIWQTRLASLLRSVGADPVTAHGLRDAGTTAQTARAAIVDLTATAYDPLEGIGRLSGAGLRVLAVGPHDDHPLRKAALAAGAERVLAYRKLHEDGPATIATWLAGAVAGPTASAEAAAQ